MNRATVTRKTLSVARSAANRLVLLAVWMRRAAKDAHRESLKQIEAAALYNEIVAVHAMHCAEEELCCARGRASLASRARTNTLHAVQAERDALCL